jgi:hypothetical protein|tara:strand:- start:4535 stop:4795 length:261 start_codon:yes stop_codon:yes gene_type:complete
MFANYDQMSVEQLLERQIELRRKVAQAHQSGMSPSLIAQMQNMLEQLMIEYHSKVALGAEQTKRERKIEEGKDPDAEDTLTIGDVE